MTNVRTRFAPSPTGFMHIGNLRTALYEYLVARHNKGVFILRIEDTDQDRNVEGAYEAIFRNLHTAGLTHDEGPDVGGDYGPYIQSLRKDLYSEYARKIVDTGNAYYCFCSKERIAALRESQENSGMVHRYDRKCLALSKEDITAKLAAGEPYVIRQKMPDTGTASFRDIIYGTITVDNKELDDQILLKSDGLPTYNFANVVDDHLMQITHVVRGNEYLSSAPKYDLLYKAFGWDIPQYIHLPLIIRPDGKKLSKRDGDPTFGDLLSMGFIVGAVINYVALLGWSPGNTCEIFSLKELEEAFDFHNVSKSPAIFDLNKLRWMNGEYLRKMSPEDFHRFALPYYDGVINNKGIDLAKISRIMQVRTEVLTEIARDLAFFDGVGDYDNAIYLNAKMKTTFEGSIANLKAAYEALSGLYAWEAQSLRDTLIRLASTLGVKNGQLLWPVRIALSGKEVTPGGAIEIADILGKEETLQRISDGIKKLSA